MLPDFALGAGEFTVEDELVSRVAQLLLGRVWQVGDNLHEAVGLEEAEGERQPARVLAACAGCRVRHVAINNN